MTRVLVIDDSRMMRRMLRAELAGLEGVDVCEAGDGVEGLQVLKAPGAGVDLVLVDWNMPRLNGIAFIKELRSSEAFARLPVIMITSQAQDAHIQEAKVLGVEHYLLKPFESGKVKEVLDRVLPTLPKRT
jgi:two-component system, chemotaxis family, chemotaxis protein CheY